MQITSSRQVSNVFVHMLIFGAAMLPRALIQAGPPSPGAIEPEPPPLRVPFTPQRLFYCGTEPAGTGLRSGKELAAFEQLMLDMRERADESLELLCESFLEAHPASPYAASVRVGLAAHYSGTCRYLAALEHWRLARTGTQGLSDVQGQRLANEARVGLGLALARQGPCSELAQLLETTTDEPLDGSRLSSEWSQLKEIWQAWMLEPQSHTACGLQALDSLAQALGVTTFSRGSLHGLHDLNSAELSLAELESKANALGMPVRAVQRRSPDLVPVPSIIHFRSRHFAAVVNYQDGLFEVEDPGRPSSVWLSGSMLNQEASGYFLVPVVLAARGMTQLDPLQSREVVGRGAMLLIFDDREPWPCIQGSCPPAEPDFELNPQPTLPGPALPTVPEIAFWDEIDPQNLWFGTPTNGLVNWRVSEPECNLWLSDTPLVYYPARGPAVVLKLDYRQRNLTTVPYPETYGGTSFGAGWHASWLGWADYRHAYLPGGEHLTFTYPSGSDLSHPEYRRNARQRVLRATGGLIVGYTVEEPDGRSWEFGHASNNPYAPWYLSRQIDAQGLALQLTYQGNRLSTITDADGGLTTLAYNPACPGMVQTVRAPGDRTVSFEPDATLPPGNAARLGSITDVEGLTSKFHYQSDGSPASIGTPYGTTRFVLRAAVMDKRLVHRAVEITEPLGATHLYAAVLTMDASGIPTNFEPSQIPLNTPFNTFETTQRHARNTLYFGPQQILRTGGDTAVESFTWGTDSAPGPLRLARIRHWLWRVEAGVQSLHTLNHEQTGSPNGTTQGALSWYDYAGKSANAKDLTGSQIRPAQIARVLSRPAEPQLVAYQRNQLGHPTTQTTSWTGPEGAWSTRSRSLTYAANLIDPVTLTDYEGRTVAQWTYDTAHRPLSWTLRPDSQTTYTTTATYDTLGRLRTLRTPTGWLSTYTYGTDGRLQSVSRSDGSSEQYSWRSGNLLTHTDARGLKRTFTYDRLNRLLRVDYPDGTRQELSYLGVIGPLTGKPHLLPTQYRNRLGALTRLEYNAQQHPVRIQDALGNSTHLDFCPCGALESVVNPLGETWTTTHDLLGHPLVLDLPEGRQRVSLEYNGLGQLVRQTDGEGSWRALAYNHQGLLCRIEQPSGPSWQATYDVHDRPRQLTDAHGITQTCAYDQLGRLLSRTYPGGSRQTYRYGPSGLWIASDFQGQPTVYTRDVAGRVLSELNPNAEQVRRAYNGAGDQLSLTDPLGRTWRWEYDTEGRKVRQFDPAGILVATNAYNAQSKPLVRWTKAKGRTAYTYDLLGRLSTINYPSSPDVSCTYDAAGRLTKMVDGLGSTRYTYYPGGQLQTVDGPWAQDTVMYAYDKGRRRQSLQLQQPVGSWTHEYRYDSDQRLIEIRSPAGLFCQHYPSAGDPLSPTSPLWVERELAGKGRVEQRYDAMARLQETALCNTAGHVLNRHRYGYNQASRVQWMERTDSSRVQYAYDPAGQLLSATGTGGMSTEGLAYTYDRAGNLSHRDSTAGCEDFVCNLKSELLSTSQGPCVYDANGNLISRVYDVVGPKTYSYTYDEENRLTSVGTDYYATPAERRWRHQFTYDGLGRLCVQESFTAYNGVWQPSGQTRFIYDGQLVLQVRTADNLPLVSYTRAHDLTGTWENGGGAGGLLAQSRSYSASTGSWGQHDLYHTDAQGSVTCLLRSPETLSNVLRYEPFGTLSYVGGREVNDLYFNSKRRIPNGTLHYYGQRFYDSYLQRWLTRDPFQHLDGPNLYAFVANDPINRLDPFGLFGTAWQAYLQIQAQSNQGCCNGVPYSRATHCCIRNSIVPKIPRYQKMGLTFNQCVGGETMLGGYSGAVVSIATTVATIAGAKLGSTVSLCSGAAIVGYTSALLGGFATGDYFQACDFCNEFICP